MQQQKIVRLLQAAIEASVYVAPTEPGLTAAELYEVGQRLGFKNGEIGDALPHVAQQTLGGRDRRLLLAEHAWHMPGYLVYREDPDLRNEEAFDFVIEQLNEKAREVGIQHASLDQNIILARADARSIPLHDIQVAIRLMLLSGQMTNDGEVLRLKHSIQGLQPLPSASRRQPNASRLSSNKTDRTQAMPHVKDVIARRTDGRPKSIEPFGAFSEQMDAIGYGNFRLWWAQSVNELNRTDPTSSPLAALVLSAALVEGVLTFVVNHARKQGLGVFASSDFGKDPRTWRIDDLVASAAKGGDTAIFDSQVKGRAEWLVSTRQRIHAGRVLSDFPQGVPDLRPEEAREAKAVAEQVTRRVLDWLGRHPAP